MSRFLRLLTNDFAEMTLLHVSVESLLEEGLETSFVGSMPMMKLCILAMMSSLWHVDLVDS